MAKLIARLILISLLSTSIKAGILGNWSGTKSHLEKNGVELGLDYTADIWSIVDGGVSQKTIYLDNFNAIARFDLQKIIGWENAHIFVYGLGNNGRSPSEYAGDVQTISNIDAPATWKIYEFWLEQKLFEQMLSIKFGLYDLNSEFDVIETAGLFINSSHGIGPDLSQSGENGPSIFPVTSLGLRLMLNLSENIIFQTAILDGVSGDPQNPNGTQIILKSKDGFLINTEIQYHCMKTIFKLGLWNYTQKSTYLLNENIKEQNKGLYFSVAKQFNDLSAFARVGLAEADLNPFKSYFGLGLVLSNINMLCNQDQLGLAIATVFFSEAFKTLNKLQVNEIPNLEVALELTYSSSILEGINVQPNIQYILNPGTDKTISNALVIGLRSIIEL